MTSPPLAQGKPLPTAPRAIPPGLPRLDPMRSAFGSPASLSSGPGLSSGEEGTSTGRSVSATPPPPCKLHSLGSSTDLVQDHHVILHPDTPATPRAATAAAELTTGHGARVLKRHMDAVLKVFATHSGPNHEQPWQRRQQTHSKSTGFAVAVPGGGSRWVLTNAHSVSYATQVQLKRRGDDDKYPARVLAVGTDCDVALLTVDDDAFWVDVHPLPLSAETPALQAGVAVLGYPIGGDSLAISAGVVSRVQMTHYSHGCMSLLALQTDAAINSGNSGGPVMAARRGDCVGIAFQSLTGNTANIGYVIPTPVVRHFLDDYMRNATYTGFPSLNIVWQDMESRTLRAAYGMAPDQRGVLVRSVCAASDEAKVLEPDDIILAIDGVGIGSDGTVPFRHGERVDLRYLITSRHVGDSVLLRVLRHGRLHELPVRLRPYAYLVPPHLREGRPPYLVVGGLVFTALSDPYLVQRYGSVSAAPVRLVHRSYLGVKTCADEQVVLLSSVLAAPATLGYEGAASGLRDAPVLAFNGKPVTCLANLARMTAACTEARMRFDLEAGGKVVILDTEAARASTRQVLEDHSITAEASPDILSAMRAEAEDASSDTAGPMQAAKASEPVVHAATG